MKVLWLGILLTFSFINCLEKREIFANNIKQNIEKLTRPVEADSLVLNFQNKLTILFYTLTLKELNEIQTKFDLSNSLMIQIRSTQYSRTSGFQIIKEKKKLNDYSFEKTLGTAIKENDGRISFALINTKSFANLIPKYETYTATECHYTWIFFKKCHDEKRQRERDLTESEKILVNEAAEYSATSSLLEAADILKEGDYELYMSDTGSIFSPDHKSVAHITYFGNIAIGPTSELNALLPIDYEYVFDPNGSDESRLVKKAIGDVMELKYYPKINEGIFDNFVVKNGYFHKFNFLIKNQLTKFPGQYLEKMLNDSEKGPYVLEIKKNGNVIFYPKKYPYNILWQTNTADKGQSPYNLHLTNEKKLILEDATGKILYQSDDYKEIPTIFYNNTRNSKSSYNGFELEYVELSANQFYLTSDNKKYEIQYQLIYRKVNLNDDPFEKPSNVDIFGFEINDHFKFFRANISNNNDFDICYTVELDYGGWTNIACNGNFVGCTFDSFDSNFRNSITNLIIYIKEKEEEIPQIKDKPTVCDPFFPLFDEASWSNL